jgi:hypothetical protein
MSIHSLASLRTQPTPYSNPTPKARVGGSFYFNARQLDTLQRVIRSSGYEMPLHIAVQACPQQYRLQQLLEQPLEVNCHSNAALALLSELSMNEYRLTNNPKRKYTILEQAELLSHRVRLQPVSHYSQHKLPFLEQEYSGNVSRNPLQPRQTGSVFTQRIRLNEGTPLRPDLCDKKTATYNLDKRIHQYLKLKRLRQNQDYHYSVNPFQF